MVRNLLLITSRMLVLSCCCVSARGASPQRTVTGIVIDADGSVLGSALVQAVPLGAVGSGGTVSSAQWVPTNDRGRFQISLPPGRYAIRGKDEKEGYPDPNFLLSADPSARFPEILVSDDDISGLQVIVGRKGGVIDGTIREADTQTAIAKAKVTIRDARNPGAFVELFSDQLGHFRFTVPSKPIRVFATAPGYSTTHLLSGKDLIIAAGDHRTILLELKHE